MKTDRSLFILAPSGLSVRSHAADFAAASPAASGLRGGGGSNADVHNHHHRILDAETVGTFLEGDVQYDRDAPPSGVGPHRTLNIDLDSGEVYQLTNGPPGWSKGKVSGGSRISLPPGLAIAGDTIDMRGGAPGSVVDDEPFARRRLAAGTPEQVPEGLHLDLAPGAGATCDAHFSTPCARTTSRWLAEKVGALLDDAASGNLSWQIPAASNASAASNAPTASNAPATSTVIASEDSPLFQSVQPSNLQAVLQFITHKKLNRDVSFYPFVFDQDGICVAHGAHEEFVGKSMKEIFDTSHLAFADPTALHERFMAAHHDWVSYLWSDDGREVHTKLAYVINNIIDASNGRSYYVGVGFQDRTLPADLPCSDRFDRWCSLNNVIRLVGRAQFELEQANTVAEFEDVVYRISFDENQYQVPGGFYLFMYSFDGALQAHGRLRDDSFGKMLWDIADENDILSKEEGLLLHETFKGAVSSSDSDEAWVQYPWRNNLEEDTYTKAALLTQVQFNNELYYVGAGFRLSGMIEADDLKELSEGGVVGEVCSDKYNLPCSFTTAHQLSSHALAYAISSRDSISEIFQTISRSSEFKHGNFYIFVYSVQSELCVSHGGNEAFVGKTLVEVFESVGIPLNATELHEQFRLAASQGGGWVKYDWVDLVTGRRFDKISYIFQMTIEGQDYYGGIGFNNLSYPVEEDTNVGLKQNGESIPCTQDGVFKSSIFDGSDDDDDDDDDAPRDDFMEKMEFAMFGIGCSEINARAILGHALAELIMSSSEASAVEVSSTERTSIEDVMNAISKRDKGFSVNNFSVGVFSFDSNGACKSNTTETGCAVAYGPNAKYVGMTWREIHDANDAVTISGDVLHQKLIEASNSGYGSGVYTYPYNGTEKRAWVAQFKHEGERYYAVADYLTADMGPTCRDSGGVPNCPSGMECTEADQASCMPIEKFPLWIPATIGTIAVLLVGAIGGYLYVNKKRKEEERKRKELALQMTEMERIIAARKNIDNELRDLDQAVGDANRQRHSLIMKRAALLGRPSTWTPSTDILVPVKPDDEEYWSVLDSLRDTIPDVHISQLWRVQNESLWSYYSFHKDRLEDNNIDPNERRVWHGTSRLDPHIVYADRMDGFMMQFAANGLWGRGIYFADKAVYSKHYSHKPAFCETSKRERPGAKKDELEMFLTRLTIGKEKKLAQDRTLTIPPIDESRGTRYNSVTGVTAGSQVWIVYENGRAYPEYLVRYYTGSHDKKRSPYKCKDEARKSKRWSSSTSFQRELSISSDIQLDVPPAKRKGSWEYLSDNGWCAYDAVSQVSIEKTYQDFTKDPSNPSIVNIKGPEWRYDVDIDNMKQKNVQHVGAKERDIRYNSGS